MNILFVTATLPYPPTDGAKIRLFSLIKNLPTRHKIFVASFVTPADHPDAIDHLRGYCEDVQVVRRDPRYPVSKILWGLVSPTPFPILNYRDPGMAALVKRMVKSHSFDIVQAEALQVAQYCTESRGCRVLDLFDIQSAVMKRYAYQQHDVLKRTYARITAKKLARYEQRIGPRFNHCLTVSPDDQDFVQKRMGFESVSVIPNGVDLDAYAFDDSQSVENNRIVFVGRMDYPANEDGVRWFCRQVLPFVQAQRPDTLLQIVGKYPSKEVKQLASPRVEVTGFVEDVRPFLKAATVCIIPLRVGGGTRLKILEGWAMGKAIVSTSVGAEGLTIKPEQDILIANDPRGFARQIVRALESPELRKSLGRAGRSVVESRYGWNMIGKCLEAVYEHILRHPVISSPASC
jgi:sugar transferase (PEP-CTERM/EpsH1 system associated)